MFVIKNAMKHKNTETHRGVFYTLLDPLPEFLINISYPPPGFSIRVQIWWYVRDSNPQPFGLISNLSIGALDHRVITLFFTVNNL